MLPYKIVDPPASLRKELNDSLRHAKDATFTINWPKLFEMIGTGKSTSVYKVGKFVEQNSLMGAYILNVIFLSRSIMHMFINFPKIREAPYCAPGITGVNLVLLHD